jgi:outer membrane immunogenic protein
MNTKLLIAFALTGIAGTGHAQSSFEGFYGQIATGYESNSIGDLNQNYTYRQISGRTGDGVTKASNQTASGVPLVFGLGYNFKINDSWLIGLGVDYSALSQVDTSPYSSPDSNGNRTNGMKLTVQDRYNIFLSPAFLIDKDKLAYLKVGYSAQTVKFLTPAQNTSPTAYVSATTTSNTTNGYILGLGYKQMISGSFYGFAEVNYMKYTKGDTNVGSSAVASNGTSFTTSTDYGASTYTLLVGVGYRF